MGKKIENRTSEDWDGIYDAQTLAAAKVIRGDKQRLKRAIKWAKVLAKEEGEKATAITEISKEAV